MHKKYWFAWYPVQTHVLWSKKLIPSGWVWLEKVSYIDTVYSGRVYTKIS